MSFIDVDQSSPDWLAMRSACVSASHMWEVMAKLKDPKKEAAARSRYKRQKVWEELTGLTAESYVSPQMEAGIEMEPLARAAYEIATGQEVQPGGLFIHDTIPRYVASPDGRVGDDGLIEAKYLTGFSTDANHLDLLLGADIPEQYQLQMTAQLACSGRKWVDFISYDPAFPRPMRLFIKRFPRDEKMIAAVELETVQFLSEVVALLKKLEGCAKEYGPVPV